MAEKPYTTGELYEGWQNATKAGDAEAAGIFAKELRARPNTPARVLSQVSDSSKATAGDILGEVAGGVLEPVASTVSNLGATTVAPYKFFKDLYQSGGDLEGSYNKFLDFMQEHTYAPRSKSAQFEMDALGKVLGIPARAVGAATKELGGSPTDVALMKGLTDLGVQTFGGYEGGLAGRTASRALPWRSRPRGLVEPGRPVRPGSPAGAPSIPIPGSKLAHRWMWSDAPPLQQARARAMAQRLDEPQTMGQILGGEVKRREEQSTSHPFIGGVVNRALDKTAQSFQRATLDPALRMISGDNRPPARGPRPPPPAQTPGPPAPPAGTTGGPLPGGGPVPRGTSPPPRGRRAPVTVPGTATVVPPRRALPGPPRRRAPLGLVPPAPKAPRPPRAGGVAPNRWVEVNPRGRATVFGAGTPLPGLSPAFRGTPEEMSALRRQTADMRHRPYRASRPTAARSSAPLTDPDAMRDRIIALRATPTRRMTDTQRREMIDLERRLTQMRQAGTAPPESSYTPSRSVKARPWNKRGEVMIGELSERATPARSPPGVDPEEQPAPRGFWNTPAGQEAVNKPPLTVGDLIDRMHTRDAAAAASAQLPPKPIPGRVQQQRRGPFANLPSGESPALPRAPPPPAAPPPPSPAIPAPAGAPPPSPALPAPAAAPPASPEGPIDPTEFHTAGPSLNLQQAGAAVKQALFPPGAGQPPPPKGFGGKPLLPGQVPPSGRQVPGGPSRVPSHLSGHQAVDRVHRQVSNEFGAAVRGIRADIDAGGTRVAGQPHVPSLREEIDSLRNMVNAPGAFTNADALARLNSNLDSVLTAFGQGSRISGESLQTLLEELRHEREFLMSEPDPQMRRAGQGIDEVRDAITRMIYRVNPAKAAERFDLAHQSWSILKPAEAAAASGRTALGTPTTAAVSPGGVPSAAQYRAAVRGADPSKDRSRWARGIAGPRIPSASGRGSIPLQVLAEQGENTFGNRFPDSGTASRTAIRRLLDRPAMAIPGLVEAIPGAAIYSRGGRAAIQRWLLSKNGQAYIQLHPELLTLIGGATGYGLAGSARALQNRPKDTTEQQAEAIIRAVQPDENAPLSPEAQEIMKQVQAQ